MKFEQEESRRTNQAGEDRTQEVFDTARKLSERLGVIARESTSFIDSMERLTPTDRYTPTIREVIEEGCNIYALGKAKLERMKRDLDEMRKKA